MKKPKEILDLIFKNPDVKYGLVEFEGIDFDRALSFTEEKGKYFLTCQKRNKSIQVYSERKSSPEEIIRQLWLYKLTKTYNYQMSKIEIEKEISFGTQVKEKAADIVVYQDDGKTPRIIIECKKPNRDDGIDQLKSYLNAEGSPIGVWSNGAERVILYRPYPKEFEDTLTDIPRRDQTIDEVLDEKWTLEHIRANRDHYNIKNIIQQLEELVLANSGEDLFNEVFKLIYAKLFDENEARTRPNKEVHFVKSKDPKVTYDRINKLFKGAIQKWPGIFLSQENIRLSPEHLNICVGPMQKTVFLDDRNLSVMDELFEYLMPDVAKSKQGQYFTPRHVIDMCIKMLNPRKGECIIDPACGSAGFLVHAMQWVWDHDLKSAERASKVEYAQENLWGIDFEEKAVKIARALMLIAGDGKSHIFKLNSLDPREWMFDDQDRLDARSKLLKILRPMSDYEKDEDNKKNFRYFNFDVLLTNPPFAGEIKQKELLKNYEIARNKQGKIPNAVERDILFIERDLNFLKPGGRMAIVLPQGKFNNTNTEFIRKFLFEKARILAVVGLDTNTFKLPAPAKGTGTKTSVLFIQKWKEKEKPLEDYPIFMATSQRTGKNSSGEYIYKKDTNGNYIENPDDGRRIVDHDLDVIAEGFVKFAKEQKFNFWK
jgi:type I restriction enzyme M protein